MSNQFLIERLEGIRQTLVSQGVAGLGMPSASKGGERETFIHKFLSEVFPPQYRFGTGAITDTSGKRSGQVDIAIELPVAPSFPVPSGDVRLYLAEGIGAVLEVKSNLSSQWKEVEATTLKVKELTRSFKGTVSFGGSNPSRKIPVFAIGYQGYKSLEAIDRCLANTTSLAKPDGVLVLEPGLFIGGGIGAEGALALYGFTIVVNTICTSVISASPDYFAYGS